MTQQPEPGRRRPAPFPAGRTPYGWIQAFLAVAAGLVALVVTAALGLWAAGAADLPDGSFPGVVAAVAVLGAGGTVELTGSAGPLAVGGGVLDVVPLSVTLAGALALAHGFLRPLRLHAVVGARELAAWAARLALLWAVVLIGLAAAARHDFDLTPGGTIADIGDIFGITASAGFAADVPLSLLYGLLWLAALLVVALLASYGAAVPARLVRPLGPVRPVAHAMVLLLLGYVALGLVAGLVTAATRGHPAETFAVILLGLPNLAWLALTLGLGAVWDGTAEGPFGLPVPRALDTVLRAPGGTTLDLRGLASEESAAWWLLVAAAVGAVAAAIVAARRSPAGTRAWQHGLRMGAGLVLTVLTVCLLCRIDARYGLSLLGLGDVDGGLAGHVELAPRWWTALLAAALWGVVTGLLAGASTLRGRRASDGAP
ncbi:streptophobe family protein [Streptomyces sp. NPDC020875]|uniref:streptophobe family protein n=1 Tax=Streptomyces sp. NPDC020875 TaxID=3154898 RepID=UPI0033F984DE